MDLSQEGVNQMMRQRLGNSYIRMQPVLRSQGGWRLQADLDDFDPLVFSIYEDVTTET